MDIATPDDLFSVAIERYKAGEPIAELIPLLVMDMYYGLNGNRVHTLLDIGKRLDVSRECVRHIKAKALRIISNWKEKNQ